MNEAAVNSWDQANQAYLRAAISTVRSYFDDQEDRLASTDESAWNSTATEMDRPPALEVLRVCFGLSNFERDLLLFCAGVELDTEFALAVARMHGSYGPRPTFGMALSVIPGSHWGALAPTASLRRWRLIELGSGVGLVDSPLLIDERVLHYLNGITYLDPRLQELVVPVSQAVVLPPSQAEMANRIARVWSEEQQGVGQTPVIQLCGDRHRDKHAISAQACKRLGLNLYSLDAENIPVNAVERGAFARLWEREAAITHSALVVDNATDTNMQNVTTFLKEVRSLCVLITREPAELKHRPSLRFDAPRVDPHEQKQLWQQALGPSAEELNGQLEQLVFQFNLETQTISSTASQAIKQASDGNSQQLSKSLWQSCRIQSRQRLDALAQRIETTTSWDDLVLPDTQILALREIAVHVRQRFTVYETWGFASRSPRGLGISALFTGVSGVGKTMAAEILANELSLDIYRIDLSQVVSKYIGETQKNLRRVFDAAEDSGAILLFDEADALFGKRSEVKDSHDRYANIDVGYLLQRTEVYRGLAILTTNQKKALDSAFLRRIRFVVQFPFPDSQQRAQIWKRIFPQDTPLNKINIEQLAKLDVAGGSIRNIALHAAFLAADEGQPVSMSHLDQAARREYAKLEKPFQENILQDDPEPPAEIQP